MENIIDDLKEDLDRSIQDWDLFVGPNSDYYISKWEKIKDGRYLSFNLAACFFVGFWMLYRKMYVACILVAVWVFVQDYIEAFLVEMFNLYHIQMYLNLGFDVLVAIVVGLIGNVLYLKKAERMIRKIKNNSRESSNYEMDIQNAGGTSPLFLGIAVVVFIAYYSWKFYF